MKVFLLLFLMGFTCGGALAHDWYPDSCCGSGDCRPVSCTTFVTHPDGSLDWTGLHFFREQVLPSRDGGCHVCVTYDVRLRVAHCAFIATTM